MNINVIELVYVMSDNKAQKEVLLNSFYSRKTKVTERGDVQWLMESAISFLPQYKVAISCLFDWKGPAHHRKPARVQNILIKMSPELRQLVKSDIKCKRLFEKNIKTSVLDVAKKFEK